MAFEASPDASATVALEIQELAEGQALECKLAAGRHGRGEVPRSFYESYSAMANTEGGVILLGIEENSPGVFTPVGLGEPERVRTDLWNGLNDRGQISANLLVDADVAIVEVEGKSVLRVRVPRARRQQRPVHIGPQPFGNTFRRNHDGDYRCDDETVRRMIAESASDTRDGAVLDGTSFDDLDLRSLQAYRNQFRSTQPDHPWLLEDDHELLRLLGGWARDRQTGREGLTLAGLLMFGKLRSILDLAPNYIVDYQERPGGDPSNRWIDRVTTDGTWSGNLFDFYRRVIQRLFDGLPVPFRLEGATRIDQTPVHVALREALVNTLIHADYGGSIPILVVKEPGVFRFRNPGVMRLPLEDVLAGGTSDCRNRNLQKMFQLAGAGEQAGSGVTRIFHGWQEQHWRAPELVEDSVTEQTTLTLRTVSLLPDDVIASLSARFGQAFTALPRLQRLALATVEIEGQVSHARLRSMMADHPADISRALSALVRAGYLESSGASRGTIYTFAAGPLFSAHVEVTHATSEPSPGQLGLFEGAGEGIAGSNISSQQDVAGSNTSSQQDVAGSNTSSQRNQLDQHHHLTEVGRDVRERRSAPRAQVEQAILDLCRGRYLTLDDMARFLGRSPLTLQNHYVSRMVRERLLTLRYPGATNHPNQAYTTRDVTA